MSLPESYEALASEIAALIEIDAAELPSDGSLLDYGLDSVRLMTLVERLRADGLEVGFEELAEEPTLRGFAKRVGLVPHGESR
jgi:aryl carrier-like protein